MRKQETIKLDGQEITVYELRVFELREIAQRVSALDGGIDNVLSGVESVLPLALNLSMEDLKNFAPSEIRVIWDVFRRVNADALDGWTSLRGAGLLQLVVGLVLNTALAGEAS